MLAHLTLQAKVQGQFTAGPEIAAEIILLHCHGAIALDQHLLEHVILHLLLAHTGWRDVEMISIMIAYADIAITAGDPVPAVSFYQGITYGF